ncbi:hypothetical protein [Candidatus Nitrosocosmicus arcticus]|uniref:hypothetical protein n=1 Tax=Candidatus Nitrosocosmicus arcticus TaxID=2035267 RepID=UPI0011A07B7B|nr:hypothetical protein [Candidatus Nitrosocosmicus arcticus]
MTITISMNTLGTGHARQNISEEIYNMFSNLTPDYLGIKNFSYDDPNGSSENLFSNFSTNNNKCITTSK